MAKQAKHSEADHLEWLVRCRSQNQHTSLILYNLMTADIKRLRKDRSLSLAGISLVSISFNLWRAVFLADVENRDADQVDHAVAFLKTLISDNAIAYAQDKNARAWSFLSYLNNARYRLVALSNQWANILPNFAAPYYDSYTLKEMWEHLQKNTDVAVGNFADALKALPQLD